MYIKEHEGTIERKINVKGHLYHKRCEENLCSYALLHDFGNSYNQNETNLIRYRQNNKKKEFKFGNASNGFLIYLQLY